MPAKNSIKIYEENAYYHLYNRGVEKRNIFLDEQDFGTFLSYLKEYLSPKDTTAINKIIGSPESSYAQRQQAIKASKINNFFGKIELSAYALMPNHFHLLIKQLTERAMDAFLNSLGTRYTMFFNRKYRRVGSLYQGVYKAVKIESDEQLLHVSRYIHLNPLRLLNLPFAKWQQIELPTSLPNYLEIKNTSWLETKIISGYFSKNNPKNTYAAFMEEPIDSMFVAPLTLDFEDEYPPDIP